MYAEEKDEDVVGPLRPVLLLLLLLLLALRLRLRVARGGPAGSPLEMTVPTGGSGWSSAEVDVGVVGRSSAAKLPLASSSS